jgi:hypothetical protein
MRIHVRKRMLSSGLLVLSLTVGAGLAAMPRQAAAQARKTMRKMTTVAGCLAKGDEAGEVWLEAKDGAVYGLEGSKKLKLSAHLGQEVTVSGYVLPEGKEEAGEEAKEEAKTGKHETADFRVVRLKMVSASCAK